MVMQLCLSLPCTFVLVAQQRQLFALHIRTCGSTAQLFALHIRTCGSTVQLFALHIRTCGSTAPTLCPAHSYLWLNSANSLPCTCALVARQRNSLPCTCALVARQCNSVCLCPAHLVARQRCPRGTLQQTYGCCLLCRTEFVRVFDQRPSQSCHPRTFSSFSVCTAIDAGSPRRRPICPAGSSGRATSTATGSGSGHCEEVAIGEGGPQQGKQQGAGCRAAIVGRNGARRRGGATGAKGAAGAGAERGGRGRTPVAAGSWRSANWAAVTAWTAIHWGGETRSDEIGRGGGQGGTGSGRGGQGSRGRQGGNGAQTSPCSGCWTGCVEGGSSN
jgi:hypothetical protein